MEDTLRADLIMPQDVSEELESLLFSMLDKDPTTRLTMKELLAHEWIIQEISNDFDFASIVPCDELEAHPDIYYSGEIFSSATALSTSHDSLSLADDESICDDIDDGHLEVDTINPTSSFTQAFNDGPMGEDLQNIANRSTIRCKTGKNAVKACTVKDESVPLSNFDCLLASPCERNRIVSKNNCVSIKSPVSNPPLLSMVTLNMPVSSPLTTSKSENNIFHKNNLALPFGLSDVVSLSDVSDESNFYEHHQMNDLSRTQVLNTLPNEAVADRIIRF